MRRVLAALLFVPLTALSQSYPTKPIRWIVPYTGGGITDVVTRVVAQKMQGPLGQSIVVDNRPGANSILGSDLAAKAAPDGYTMVTVIAGYAANVTLYQGKLPFDPRKDLVPVSLAGIAPLILTANNNLPAKDARELIAYAKANPGKLNFGSSGIGAAAHLTTELFKQTVGIDMVHVPFKGTAPALTALMANDIQILVDVPSTLMPHVRGGKIKALAMFSKERIQGAPEVPTLAQAGGPALESSTWVLFMAPGGTPKPIIDRLAAETAKAINESDIKERFNQIGIVPVGNSPAQAVQFLEEEIAKWAKVITTAGVKAEQ
ncbi:MAG TPA: tripartite tricarboxylate transporter substrate binding protein [Burkholderiales bacterium]|jgi:tripartite-type tricarboxylate transporter receptor subunit TctC|nr:tripartite tricarboxylate transporter substrate binding protein [Burkholderiales bacterium]